MFLELYKDKIPEVFEQQPGADNYVDKENLFWAVLMTQPSSGSPEADYIAPFQIQLGAVTHGTDTLTTAGVFDVTRICVWNPKYPPYRFRITPPNGQTIDITPPGQGEEDSWFCLTPSQPIANCTGIWTVEVEMDNAHSLPETVDGSNAQLNHDMLTFDQHFEHQPLLKVEVIGTTETVTCPDFDGISVGSGCAPGEVTFRANLTQAQLQDIEEISWDFGDGTTESYGPGYADGELQQGIEVTHTYEEATNEEGENWIATVSILRHQGCIPRTRTEEETVPTCRCPVLDTLEVISTHRCTPGNVRFRAGTSNPGLVGSYVWQFDDGSDPVRTATNEVTHQFNSIGDYSVSVAIEVPAHCMASSRSVQVPPCSDSDEEESNGETGLCSLWLWLWIGSLIVATILVGTGTYWGTAFYVAYLAFLLIWAFRCCWPCASRPWRCCGFLQWHFIALSWVGAILPWLGLAGFPIAWVEFGISAVILVVLFILMGIARCRIPNPFWPDTYPGPTCQREFWLDRIGTRGISKTAKHR